MYPIPPSEHLIETRSCRQCSSLFPITNKDMEFYEKVSPSFSGKRYLIPPPTLCPECRQQRRLAFHNERSLYKRNCNATGKEIISMYSPDKPYTVYAEEYWWSDAWNPLDYGMDIDFTKRFLSQYHELFHRVPKNALLIQECENAAYLNFVYRLKNCYHVFAS